MAEKMDWKAYGDVNPLEHGGIWIREDADCRGSFYIVKWEPNEEKDGEGHLSHGYVTPTDDWIDADDVYSFSGTNENSSWEEKAMAAFDYYSVENFEGETVYFNRDELLDTLKIEGIEV